MQKTSRILAVDDNPLNLTVLKSLLADYTVQTATSGADALEKIPMFRPDLVLLDIMMPGIDGYATCRQIRSNPSLGHTKIIMVSAKGELNERLAGYEAGADDYLTKPFDGDELLAKVRVYLKLKSVEEVEEVKNRTIEVLQHSNRTPLNNIISYAELLAGGYDLDQETRTEAPKVILRHARRLHRLLEKAETLASVKSGQFLFEFRHGDICTVIRNTLDELEPRISDRNLIIESTLPWSADATFDEEQMQFIVRALLDNAIRFSDPGGIITVEVVQRDGDLVLTVADQGTGISDDILPCVFEAFGNPESPLFNQGDGLSLAIVQQIAWAHDGDIRAESEGGNGATFSMRIPVGGPDRQEEVEQSAHAQSV